MNVKIKIKIIKGKKNSRRKKLLLMVSVLPAFGALCPVFVFKRNIITYNKFFKCVIFYIIHENCRNKKVQKQNELHLPSMHACLIKIIYTTFFFCILLL